MSKTCPCCGQPLPDKLSRWQFVSEFLSPSEWKLFKVLYHRVPNAVTMDAIYAAMYGGRSDDPPHEQTIRQFIHRLRKKLRPFGFEIANRYGSYRLVVPDLAEAAE